MLEAEYKKGKTVTVFSTASAAGKTLISINAAAELARQGNAVCLVDLDLQFGDVKNYLALQPDYTIFDVQEKLRSNPETTDVISLLTEYSYREVRFSVLPASAALEEAYYISTDFVLQMLHQLQEAFDYIILDTAAAFSELNLAVMDISQMISFIGIVDFIPTIKNMKIGYDTMRSIGYDRSRIQLVLNRSDSKTSIELKDVSRLLGEQFSQVLPNEFGMASQSIRNAVPLVLMDTESSLQQSLRALAIQYTDDPEIVTDEKRGLFGLVKKIFE